MEENLDLLPKADLYHDARLLLPEHPNPEGYVDAIVDCDLHSEYLPLTGDNYLSVLHIIADFCELPPMLPHIHSFIDALWDFNRGSGLIDLGVID